MAHDNFTLPADGRRGPNCGVTAIAASTGNSFARVWALCKAQSGKSRFKGGTYHIDRLAVLNKLGAQFEIMQLPRMTLQTFCNKYAQPDTTYMVTTTGHVQLVRIIEGKPYVLDQGGCKAIDEHRGRRKFIYKDTLRMAEIERAVEIQPKAKPTAKPQHPQANSSLFPSLFPNQHKAQAPLQLSLF